MNPIFPSLRVLCLTFLVALTTGQLARAEWWGREDAPESDILIQELSVPYWAESTYYSCWNMDGYRHQGPYFYAGFSNMGDDSLEAIPNTTILQWAFWPAEHNAMTSPIWNNPLLYPYGLVGEGAAGKVFGYWPLSSGVWYKHVLRFWDAPKDKDGKESNITYAGWWMRDMKSEEWHMLAMMKIPAAHYRASGSGGFLEDSNHGCRHPRAESFRGFYGRGKDGAWHSGNIQFLENRAEEVRFTKEQADGSVFFEQFGKTGIKGQKEPKIFFKQAPTPAFDPIQIKSLSAQSCGKQVAVSWELENKSSPQFSVELKIRSKEHVLVATHVIDNPATHQVLLTLPTDANQCEVVATINDIFDASASKKTLAKELKPILASSMPAGAETTKLDVLSYESANKTADKNAWQGMPDFATLSPVQQGRVSGLDLSARTRLFGYALKYVGGILVPKDGLYLLHLKSADNGSQLFIDQKQVVDNARATAPFTRSGIIALKKGFHSLEVDYFSQLGGSNSAVTLEWEGPNLEREKIPLTALVATGHVPQASMQITTTKKELKKDIKKNAQKILVLPSCEVELQADISKFGDDAKVNKVIFKENELFWAQINQPPLLAQLVLPAGKHKMSALVYYGENAVVDSTPIEFEIKAPDITPWELTHVGPNQKRGTGAAVSDKGQSLTLLGDGLLFASQSVKGDFTLSGKLVFAGNATGAQGASADCTTGLMVRGNKTNEDGAFESINFNLYFKGRLASSTLNDATTTGIKLWQESEFAFAPNQWMRLVRKGNDISFFTSVDNKEWKFLRTISDPAMPAETFVGPYLSQTANLDNYSFKVEWAELKIEKGNTTK